jgi:SAM-dependent methyltransferase
MAPGPSPLSHPASFWSGRYAELGYAYGEQPNDFLLDQAAALPPGDALCLAEGEGRNAVHLAQLGYRVLAQDLSAVGLAKAVALAQSRGVTIQTCCGDLAAFHPAPQSVDLVVAIWMHLPPPLRAQVLSRAVAALRPGGHLILEAYTPRQLELGTGGPPQLELLCEPEDLRSELAGLELLVLQERRRWIAEGPYHHGDSAVVQVLGRKPL